MFWTDDNQVWNWGWRRDPRGCEKGELELMQLLSNVSLESHQQDSWHCDFVVDGSFSVRMLARTLDDKWAEHNPIPPVKQRLLPMKVNLFLWRARRDFLPCYLQLAMRGLNISSLLCPLCYADFGSIDHVLLRFTVVTKVWRIVAKWCGVQGLFLWETQDLNSQEVAALVPAAAKPIWEAILGVTAWCI